MAIYRVNKQDVCRFYKEDFWGELRIRRNVYARINKFLFGRKKRKFDNSTRFDVIKLDNTRFKRRKRLTKEEIRYIQKEKIKHYFLNLSEYGLRAILLRTKSIKTSKGQNYRERNVRDAFTNRLDHLIFSFGWATSLGHARTLIKKGAIQVNHFIPTRIDFIPMPGDEIQVRKTYKPIIRRKLIGLRQKRLKIDFKLNRLRLIYYLFNVRKKRWKNVRPKFFYNKLKLFRHPRIRWLNYTTTNRYYRFYKNTPTRFSKLLNSFHPKNFNRIKTRFAYPFIPDSNTYHSYIKNRLLKLRDLEYKYEENTPPNNFSWLYKLRRMSPSKIRRLLKKDANVTEDGTEVFRKDFIPQTNRERLHSRHSYNRPDANKNSKQKNNKSFKNQKWRKKKKFNKYVSDQTVLESNLFFRNRWLYFKIINNPAKRARVRELDKKLAYAARHKQEFDNFITSNKSIYNQPLAALKSEIDLFDSLLGLDDIGSGCRAPLYWAELFRYLIVTVFSYRDVKSNKDEYFGPKSLLLKSMLNSKSVNGVGTKQNKDENKDENKDDDVENHEYLHLLSSKIIKIIFTKAKLSSTEPTELKFKIGLAAFVNYLQCQQSGLNHFVNLLNNKKNDFGQLFSFSFGPSSVNSLYKFTRDILNWPTFFSLNSEKNPYIILHQLRFNYWRSNHTNSYRLLKGVIEHYYSYFAFFYSKSNFLTIKKKGALHYFLRFLKHLLRPKVTPEQRLLALKFPNLIPRPYRKKAVGFTSIAEARRSAKDRAMPIFISDYSIPLLMARVKTVRGILYPQFEALARNILKVNKTLIKTFIKDSSSLIPSKWLNLPKLRKSRYKITSKFLTRLILRLSRRLGIPVFNRPIYNLKLGIRGRAKQLLDKQVNLIENTTFPNYNRLYYPTKIKRFNRKLKRLKRRALRVRYRTLIARRFPNFIINYKLLLAIYLGPKRMFKNRRFKHRTRRAKLGLKRTLRFRRRKNKLFRVNRRKKRHFFYYFPFKFNLKTILTYYGNGKRSERLNRENDVYVTYPTTPYNLRY